MHKSYVYIMQSGRKKDSPIKIGVADNPESRMSELQTGNPERLILIAKIEQPNRKAAYNLEAWLHNRFRTARINGEWFDAKRCGLKRAFGVWESINKESLSVKRVRIHSKKEDQLSERIVALEKQNQSLKSRVRQLEQDIEEYLDGESQNHINFHRL